MSHGAPKFSPIQHRHFLLCAQPLQGLALGCLTLVDPESHKELLRNVVLTGGGACLSGLPERFDAELKHAARRCGVHTITNQAHRITLHAGSTAERRHGVWIGGSVLASMGSYQQIWMSKAEYEEHGAAFISRKGLNHSC